jgi:hypothetical protein
MSISGKYRRRINSSNKLRACIVLLRHNLSMSNGSISRTALRRRHRITTHMLSCHHHSITRLCHNQLLPHR